MAGTAREAINYVASLSRKNRCHQIHKATRENRQQVHPLDLISKVNLAAKNAIKFPSPVQPRDLNERKFLSAHFSSAVKARSAIKNSQS